MFKNMLRSGETLFRNSVFLSFDFQPKILYGRENEQQRFAVAIRPLFSNQSGRNLFVYGSPGVGKTTACRHVLRELGEETDDIVSIYVNCWKENTTYKIFTYIAEELGFKFIQNKKTTEIWQMIISVLNKKSVVFVFDEIDKLEDTDFLYTVLEDVYRKTLILITNYRDTYGDLDERIRSRLVPEFVNFRAYSENDIAGILAQRKEYAFVQNCWEPDAFKEIVEKCCETNDVRVGLFLMKEAGQIAEEKSSRLVTNVFVSQAIKKVDDFHIKPKEGLDVDLQKLLSLIQEMNGEKIGDIFSAYSERGGAMSYKSFQRRITKLKEARFISTEKTHEGGNSTIVHYAAHKKLTEF